MEKPNIVFILIDDLGWRDITCAGSEFYETPNIDRLAKRGMQFTSAYASCPVCSPSRASAMTGKYPATVGITDWIDWCDVLHPLRGRLIDVPYLKELPTSEYTIANALRDSGYRTWHVGKWHLGAQEDVTEHHGFDVNIGGCHWGMPSHGYFAPWQIPALDDSGIPEGTYLTDYLTDRAIELIEQNDDTPFYLNMCYYSVHIPIQAKQEKIQKYEAKAKAMGLDKVKTFEEGEPFPTEHKKDQRIKRRLVQSDPVYAAMIESLDENIGRLLDAIEAKGISENTFVTFTADNGGVATSEGSPTTNLPLINGKGWMYEGGTRVALLAQWPDVIEPGSTCDEPVTSTDFYPTFLEAAGIAPIPEQHTDGVSLMPLFKGGETLDRDALFWHYPHYGNQGGTPGASVRMGDYKLIRFFEDERIELYNLKDDPSESHNLAQEQSDRAQQMKDVLLDWQTSVEAKIPQPNPDWRTN